MRLGMLPSQKRALARAFRKADKFDHFRQRTRRTLLFGGVGALFAAAGSFWAGASLGRPEPPMSVPPASVSPRLGAVHRIAAEPDAEFWSHRFTFLAALEESGGDAVGGVALRRLTTLTLARGSDERALAFRILRTLDTTQALPVEFCADLIARLQPLLR